MRARAAVLRAVGLEWEITDVDLDEPRDTELLVRVVATGLCHSDDHYRTGDLPAGMWPLCAGHEGAGVVEATGPAVTEFKPGDHVALAFIPPCGKCRFCATGRQRLCGSGARMSTGSRADGTFRMTENGVPVAQAGHISTFSNYTLVDENSAVRIPAEIPLETACLVSCGVATGFGSAENSAQVQAGDTVIVMGIGGIGINAVQGAAFKGALNVIAVDPVAFKRESALKLGATDAFESIAEATAFARSVTDGQGADAAIVCVGVTSGEHIAQAFDSIRKGGTVVMTGVGKYLEKGIPVSPTEMTFYNKRLQGAIYGEMNPSTDIGRLLALYQSGRLHLDELITRTYRLSEINQGYRDMHAGLNLRGVLLHEH